MGLLTYTFLIKDENINDEAKQKSCASLAHASNLEET